MIRIEAFNDVHPQEGHEDAKCDHFLDDFQIERCEFADFARSGDNPSWNVGLFFTTAIRGAVEDLYVAETRKTKSEPWTRFPILRLSPSWFRQTPPTFGCLVQSLIQR
jgi:hypothetical protein